MYSGYQEKLFSNSWGVNSGFETVRDQLNELIPLEGACENPRTKNKALDKFRRAQNAAYDLFNNGLCNKRGLFNQIYGFAPTMRDTDNARRMQWSHWEDRVEEVLTPIIIAAALEQGIK
jgi:hypothetical protein|tara:strand:+ start:2195 stop:2551 length:357 start_codon:yes stop_codon:yes gene_type:complete